MTSDNTHEEFLGATRLVRHDTSVFARGVLLVGEDNPQSADPVHQLFPYPTGCAGERLCNLILGMHTTHDYRAIWRTNLCSPSWDSKEAITRAYVLMGDERRQLHLGEGRVMQEPIPWRTIIMLGRKVAKIFQHVTGHLDPFESSQAKGLTFLSLPHPSGLCREWNDPEAIRRTRRVLRELEPEIPWGVA